MQSPSPSDLTTPSGRITPDDFEAIQVAVRAHVVMLSEDEVIGAAGTIMMSLLTGKPQPDSDDGRVGQHDQEGSTSPGRDQAETQLKDFAHVAGVQLEDLKAPGTSMFVDSRADWPKDFALDFAVLAAACIAPSVMQRPRLAALESILSTWAERQR